MGIIIGTSKHLMIGGKSSSSAGVPTTISGVSPILFTSKSGKLYSLKRFGKVEQTTTPTPSDPVNIVCNNGVIKYGWLDIITTNQLSGYGTYVSPSGIVGNRAYRWLKDLPNGTYQFAVDGDYEIIVQWRDPADPADGVARFYENLSGWMTSGEVTLDKSTGGYGIAVRRTSGTDITPSNFDGVIHVQERGLYVDGTSEVLTVSADGVATQTASVENILSVGDYKDEQNIISGLLTHRVGIKVLDGTENWSASGTYAGSCYTQLSSVTSSNYVAILTTHFEGWNSETGYRVGRAIYNMRNLSLWLSAETTPTTLKQYLADQYAAGTPVIILYPLAIETTEHVTPQHMVATKGSNMVTSVANVSNPEIEITYSG